MADNETIAEIIAEMRRIRVREFQDYADRLDAAHRRERGNAAKLREALAYLFTLIDMRRLVLDCNETEEISAVQVMLDECRAALSAPPRNCDIVPIEASGAADIFHRERPLHGYDYETHDWLFAPAAEKEGGDK